MQIDQGDGFVEMCLPTCKDRSCRRVTPQLFFSCMDTRRYDAAPHKPGHMWLRYIDPRPLSEVVR